MLFPYFVYIVHFTKLTQGSPLFVLVKQEKKNRPKEERKSTILLRKEKKNSFVKVTSNGRTPC